MRGGYATYLFARKENRHYSRIEYLVHSKAASAIFCTNHALLLCHLSKVACQRRARNIEQLRRASLIATCLLINEPDVPFYRTRQRKIDACLMRLVVT